MNVPPIGEVTKLVKLFQAMFLKHNGAHMALIQALGERGGVSIPESKILDQAYQAHYLDPFIGIF
jgi:hypothetical protein